MTLEQLPTLTQSGVYLLSRPKKVSVSLEDFLVITLHSPSSSSTALILQSVIDHRKDFLEQLENIHQKYSSLSDVDPNLIQSKVFGTGDKFSLSLSALRGWLKKNHIPVIASDLGRALPGELILDSGTGRVGIQYKKNTWEQFGTLLSTGTARNRSQALSVSHRVLVLSSSSVIKTLAQQSIEEEPHWSASCPKKLDESTIALSLSEHPWSAVIVSDELKTEIPLMTQLISYAETHSSVPIAWIGGELPHWKKEISRLRLLPPLEPFLIPHFKRILKQSIFELSLKETSETLNFPNRKKARS